MARPVKPGRLSARWDKREEQALYWFPTSAADGDLLHGALYHQVQITGRTLVQEVEARGYDLTTLRVQIDKKKPA